MNKKTRYRSCLHHWQMMQPEGNTVRGICLKCGKTRCDPVLLEIDEAPYQDGILDWPSETPIIIADGLIDLRVLVELL